MTLDMLYLKRNLERCGRGLILEKWSVLHATDAREDKYHGSATKTAEEKAFGSRGHDSTNHGKQKSIC